MLPGYVLFIIFSIILFLYTRHHNQLVGTTSTLREIFSGSCQLPRGATESERFAAHSGLQQIQATPSPVKPVKRSRECICTSCPCEAINDVLKKLSPATELYDEAIDKLSDVYYHALQAVLQTYDDLNRVLECRVACQRQVQLKDTASSHASTEHPHSPKDKLLHSVKSSITKLKSAKMFSQCSMTAVRSAIFKDVAKSKTSVSESDSETVLPSASQSVKSCPRCAENSQVCMSKCPRAVAKKK